MWDWNGLDLKNGIKALNATWIFPWTPCCWSKANHCVKSVRIRIFLVSIFPHSVYLRIQSECGNLQTRITPNTDNFHAVQILYFNWLSSESALWEAGDCRDPNESNPITLFDGMSFQKYFFEDFVSKKTGEKNNFWFEEKSTCQVSALLKTHLEKKLIASFKIKKNCKILMNKLKKRDAERFRAIKISFSNESKIFNFEWLLI